MRLYIIRHAWAGDPGPEWPDDAQRPLTDDGRAAFAKWPTRSASADSRRSLW